MLNAAAEGRASWLSVVGSARQGAASRQMRPLANETEQSPHVDRFTCLPEAIPVNDIRAETVADAFFGGWVARFGTPATITTDRGAQFKFRLWDTLCNQFGITRNRTVSYHP